MFSGPSLGRTLLALLALAAGQPALAETCAEKYARLEVLGNEDTLPVRLTITSQAPDGTVTKNYHYSDVNRDGMTEMIEPADMAWSLFIGNDMYVSNDKGKSWSHMNSWDKQKAAADTRAMMQKDMEGATDIACGEDSPDGTVHDTVEGRYNSTMLQGAPQWSKFWVSRETGRIVRKDSITDSAGGQYKTTQIIEPWPDFVLPKP